ncbi:MAG: hypothetical protein WBP01_06410, partial [Ferruginibacter sp.]
WNHNYELFKSRKQRGVAVQSSGDRASYDRQLPGLMAQYQREQSALHTERMMYAGIGAGIAAPLAVSAVLESGAVNGAMGLYSTMSVSVSELSFNFGSSVYAIANNVRNTIGIGTASYFTRNSEIAKVLNKWGDGTFQPLTSEGLINFRENYQTVQYYFPNLLPQMP